MTSIELCIEWDYSNTYAHFAPSNFYYNCRFYIEFFFRKSLISIGFWSLNLSLSANDEIQRFSKQNWNTTIFEKEKLKIFLQKLSWIKKTKILIILVLIKKLLSNQE